MRKKIRNKTATVQNIAHGTPSAARNNKKIAIKTMNIATKLSANQFIGVLQCSIQKAVFIHPAHNHRNTRTPTPNSNMRAAQSATIVTQGEKQKPYYQ